MDLDEFLEDDNNVSLAKIVRSEAGVRKFKMPIGSIVQSKSQPSSVPHAKSPNAPNSHVVSPKLKQAADTQKFMKQVAAMRAKLDKYSIEQIREMLNKMENDKAAARNPYIQRLKGFIQKYLKSRLSQQKSKS